MPAHAEDRTLVVLGWLLLVASLITDPFAFNPYTPLRVATLAGALGIGALLVRRAEVVLPRWLIWGGGGLFAVTFLASTGAPVPWESLVGDSERRFGALTVALLPVAYAIGVGLRAQRGIVLRAAPVTVGLLGAVMLANLPRIGLAASQTVLVGNAGQLGGVLLVLTGGSLAVALSDGDARWSKAAWAAVALGPVLTILTGSQAGIAGQVALVAGGVWASGVLGGERPRWLLPGAALSAVGLVVIAVTWSAQFRGLTESLLGRLDVWRVSLAVIAERPVLGWGAEGFRHGFAQVAPESFVITYGDDRIQDRAHSLLLDVAGATGLVGLAAFVACIVLVWRRIDRTRPAPRGLAATLVAVFVFLLAWFPTPSLAASVLLLAGLAVLPPGEEGWRPQVMDVRTTRWSLRVLATLGIVSAGLGGMAVVEDHQFRGELDAILAGGTDAAAPMSHAATAAGGITQQLIALDAARAVGTPEALVETAELVTTGASGDAWRDDSERAYIRGALYAMAYERSGDPEQAELARSSFNIAVFVAPTHSPSWRGMATLALQRGDPQAGEVLARAAALRPGDVSVIFDQARLALANGDADQAAAALARVCEVAPDDRRVAVFSERLIAAGIVGAGCS